MNSDFFDWDQGNIEKVQKHGLKLSDVEQFLLSNPLVFRDDLHSKHEIRFIALDEYKGRLLFIVFVLRSILGVTRIRVVSARFSKHKEKIRYEEKIKKIKKN